jgi:hypothetical protein
VLVIVSSFRAWRPIVLFVAGAFGGELVNWKGDISAQESDSVVESDTEYTGKRLQDLATP